MSFDRLFKFEQDLAKYTGAPYVVVTDGCTHALEIALRYDQILTCEFSAYTYLSVPMLMHHLHIDYQLTDETWTKEYQLHGTRIWDSARRLEPGMYLPGQMQCLSFGISKPLQVGKVGCVLTDDFDAYQAMSRLRSDGRDLRISPWELETHVKLGYHYCPTLELCSRGSELLAAYDHTIDKNPYVYPDCRKVSIVS